MDIFKQYATDATLENGGAWFPLDDKTSLLVARSGNRAYSKAMLAAFQANKVLLDVAGDAADDLSEKLISEVMAKTILLGWKGVEWQGKPLEYSEQNAEMLLKLKDFRVVVKDFADKIDGFRVKEEEALEKN